MASYTFAGVLVDLRTTSVLDLPPAPVLVVGSGAAGLALALTLGDGGEHVVLLESGGDVTDAEAFAQQADLNQGVVEGQSFEGLEQGRARVLGGTTRLWHGQCMRLHDIDLGTRSWIPDSGWPLTSADLAGPYAAAERWLEVSGRGYDAARWDDHRSLPPVAWDSAHLLHDFTEYMRRPDLGAQHRAALSGHPRVHAVLNATVAEVRVVDGVATGVVVISPSGTRITVPARTVVLAAGTLENTRLLQLSDPEGVGLGTGREHTGRYLQDHPIIRTAEVIPADFRVLQDRYVTLRRQGRRLFPKVRLAPQAQAGHQLVDATAVFVHEHDDAGLAAARRLLLAARARTLPAKPLREAATAVRAVAPLAQGLYRRHARGLSVGARPAHVWLQLWLEQAPVSDRRITLAQTRDRFGLRQANVRWGCEPIELETSRLLTRWIAADLARLGIAQVRELPVMADDDAWRSQVTDAAHPAGTTRMATSPREGVVDPDLQVHGVEQLFVVGGSVFPTSGYANPTLTIVALALRLAEHLARAPRLERTTAPA